MFWQGLKYHQLQANKDAVSTCILRNKPGRNVIINSKKFRSGGKTSAEVQTTFRGEMRQAAVFFSQMECEFITNNLPTRATCILSSPYNSLPVSRFTPGWREMLWRQSVLSMDR